MLDKLRLAKVLRQRKPGQGRKKFDWKMDAAISKADHGQLMAIRRKTQAKIARQGWKIKELQAELEKWQLKVGGRIPSAWLYRYGHRQYIGRQCKQVGTSKQCGAPPQAD